MPRQEKALDATAGPVAAFAVRLREKRQEAALTYRELAARTPYSHAHMVRAAGGDELASWLVVRAYLVACGVTHTPVLRLWEQFWIATNDVVRAEADKAGDNGVALPLRHITTPVGFGEHLRAFANLKAEQLPDKPFSLRALATQTGIPRSTLGEWFSGQRLPSVGGLYQFAGGLGATAGEQAELRQVRDRLDTEKRLSLDLEHYTLRALNSLELRETVDPRQRLAVSHALLRAGEQRLHNDAALSTWKVVLDSSASSAKHRADQDAQHDEALQFWSHQARRLTAAESRMAQTEADREGPGVWGSTVARKLHSVVDTLESPQAPPPPVTRTPVDDQ